MNCTTSAVIGLGLLGASLFTMSVSEAQHEMLKRTFSEDLDRVYDSIVQERRNQYLQGLILGFIIAYGFTTFSKITNRFYRMSLFVAISLMTSVLYYFLIPKSDYMLNHLKTEEQNKAWLQIYKTMKMRYIFGFLFGAVAAIPIAQALC